jgi:hypothetical protein
MSETSVVTELSDAEILGLKLSDLHYYGFYWEKNPDKPILIIRIQPQNAPLQELVCDWAANLKSAMELQNESWWPVHGEFKFQAAIGVKYNPLQCDCHE